MTPVRFDPYFREGRTGRKYQGVLLGSVQTIDGTTLYIIEGIEDGKGITALVKENEFEEEK